MKKGLLFISLFILSSSLSFGQAESSYDLFQKGKIALNNEEYKKANELFEECLIELEKSTTIDSLLFGEVHLEIGSTQTKLSDNKKALVHAEIAYDMLTRIDTIYLDHARLIHLMAYTRFYNSKYKESQPFFKRGIQIYRNKQAADTLSFLYQFLGSTFYRLTDYDKALVYCDSAETVLKDYDPLKSLYKLMSIYDSRGDIRRRQRQFDEAIRNYDQSIVFNQQLPVFDTASYINVMEGKSTVFSNTGNDYKALKTLKEVEKIAIKKYGEFDAFLIPTYINIGFNLNNLGRYSEALAYLNKAVTIAKSHDFEETYYVYLSAYPNIGDVHLRRSNYEEAYTYFKKSYDLNEKKYGKNHPRTLRMAEAVALTLSKIGGKEEQAINLLSEVNDIYLKKYGYESKEVAENLGSLGSVYFNQGKPFLATPLFEKSVAIRRKVFGNEHLSTATGLKLLGESYFEDNQYELAERVYQELLKIYEPFPATFTDRAPVFYGLSEIYLERKEFEKASKAIDDAMLSTGFDTNKLSYDKVDDLPFLVNIFQLKLHWISAVFEDTKDARHLKILTTFKNKINGVATYVRSGAIENKSKQKVEAQLSELFSKTAILMNYLYLETDDLNDFEQSLIMADAAKNARLLANLQFDNLQTFAGVPKELIDQEQLLRSEIFSLEQRYNKTEEDEKQAIEDQLFEKRTALYNLNDVFKNEYPSFFELKHQTKPVSLSRLRADVLKDKQAIIHLNANEDEILVLCVSENGIFSNLLKTKSIESDLDKLQRIDKTITDDLLLSASNLYTQLLKPVIDQLPTSINNLVIVSDEKYTYFPFESLVTNSSKDNIKYLFEDYTISYAYSIALLEEQYKSRDQNRSRVLTMAPIYFDIDTSDQIYSDLAIAQLVRSGNYKLPGALEEASIIADFFNGTAFLNETATETAFKKNAKDFSTLHLSMHAIMDEDDPMNSRLLFYNDTTSIDDGLLYAYELYNMKLNADLVVLSACNTGQGQLVKGEGVMGISRAFAYAGTPSTVMSLWKVPDESTSKIMVAFYKHLKDGASKSEALRNAKLDYLESVIAPEQTHPYYWAGFILSGNDDPISLESGWSIKTILLLSFLCLALLWISMRKK
jgi:CHAT domain-containing protein/tetratricopeptide (TPR) repeat protein